MLASRVVVDDEPAMLKVSQMTLEGAGYDVITFDDPIEALGEVQDGLRPDVVVSDVSMPPMDGFEFYANVREIPENVPADNTVDALGGARHGITDFRRVGYGGPCPPDRRHTYRFMLYALDTELDLEPGANRKQLDDAMKGHIIAEAMLRATYDRPNR